MCIDGQAASPSELGQSEPTPFSPFALHVGHVGGLRVEEQVLGIHAATYIAAMADHLASRNWPLCHDPSEAMGAIEAAPNANLAISLPVNRCLPDVASGQRIDLYVVGKALLGGPRSRALPECFRRNDFCRHGPTIRGALLPSYSGQWLCQRACRKGVDFAVHCPECDASAVVYPQAFGS
jgi:hypothetical protein